MPSILGFRNLNAGHAVFEGTLDGATAPGWHLFVLILAQQSSPWSAALNLLHAGDVVGQVAFPQDVRRRPGRANIAVIFLDGRVEAATLTLSGVRMVPDSISLRHSWMPTTAAALASFAFQPKRFLSGLCGPNLPARERLRAALAAATQAEPRPTTDYENWLARFDDWSDKRLQSALASGAAGHAVRALVFARHEGAALNATLKSLRSQIYPLADIHVVRPGAVMPACSSEFTLVLQAGEEVAWHALPLLVQAMADRDAVYADEDRLASDRRRSQPSFKPQPGLVTMCSGLLSKGAWLVRSILLAPGIAPAWAESLRLELWFRLDEQGRSARTAGLPFLLTHVREDAQTAPADAVAAVVGQALERRGVAASVVAATPLRLAWTPDHLTPVDVIVPSRLDGALQAKCMLGILRRTSHPNFMMHVVVSQAQPLNARQRELAAELEATGKARVSVLERADFNFSAANNHVAAITSAGLICLLNDDVDTSDGDWLGKMAAMFSHPGTGIAGAKLCYPDGRVQHGGVVMGLAGLAEHAHRFLGSDAAGYMGRAVIDQEMSAVTGACLMIRRDVFDRVGGLDEGLASAFNDVDLCLRVRQLGLSVIMAGSIVLTHHESVSYGHHFGHDREAELAAARVMQGRWPDVIAADPYYNPNLSLLPKSEWKLAEPPRL